nr:MAG TPA: hypothetical protein [Caudoviricetes sp.]
MASARDAITGGFFYSTRSHVKRPFCPLRHAPALRRLRGLLAEVVARQHRRCDRLQAIFLRVRQQLQQRRQRGFLLLSRQVAFRHHLSLPFFPSLPNLCYTVRMRRR